MKQESDHFLEAGARFPDFQLPADDGRTYTLSSLLGQAPAALIAVFKTDCPTSQFSLPYWNGLLDQIPGFPFIGISQDDAADTAEFIEQWGARFSRVLYEEDPYPLSDALGITHVPSLFLVAAGGRILASDFGYSAQFWESLAQKAGAEAGVAVGPILPLDAPRWALG
ncbi:MAG: TlpA family protein disulfide reductase [Acidobacteria bacterium]|nr:TlpA family protein disulfide reductase [Acidobacteriota bacterium]